MKTMKKVLPLVAFALVAVAIVLSFFAGMRITAAGTSGLYKNVIWGCKEIDVDGNIITIKSLMNVEKVGVSVLPVVGLALMLVGGVGALLVALLAKKPSAKWLVLACGVLILAGAIMQFFILNAFGRAMVTTVYKEAGITDQAEIEKAVKEGIENLKKQDPKFVVSTVMGILGCVGGVAAIGGALLPEKK